MKKLLAFALALALCLTACAALAETRVSFFTGKIEINFGYKAEVGVPVGKNSVGSNKAGVPAHHLDKADSVSGSVGFGVS